MLQDGGSGLAAYLSRRQEIDTHLVLTASMRLIDLYRAAALYSSFRPSKLIFTRLDETSSMASVFCVAARRNLPVSFLAAGQSVPDDLAAGRQSRHRPIIGKAIALHTGGGGLINAANPSLAFPATPLTTRNQRPMATGNYGYQTAPEADAALRREALVLQHLPQVRLIAKRIHDRLPDYISLDDLVSTGVVGLLAAIDNFDPSLNVQLKTYAERKIRFAILDGLRDMDWAPRELRKKSKMIEAAIHRVNQRAGREATEDEIAAELGVSLENYQKWLGEVQSVELERLESAGGEDGGQQLLNFISGDPESIPSRIVERSELERLLALAIDRMPKIERTVLNLYYFEELTLREIAEIVGMHLSRVAQLRTQAILRLRSHLERVWLSQPVRKIKS